MSKFFEVRVNGKAIAWFIKENYAKAFITNVCRKNFGDEITYEVVPPKSGAR